MECRSQTQEFLLNTCVPVCQLLSLIGTKFTKYVYHNCSSYVYLRDVSINSLCSIKYLFKTGWGDENNIYKSSCLNFSSLLSVYIYIYHCPSVHLSYLSIPCMQCPSRSGEKQQPVSPDVVQKIQYNLLVLISTNEAVPLICLHSQHIEGLLPEEVHSLIWQNHPGFESGLLGGTHSPSPSAA